MRVLHAVHGYPPEFRGGSELYVARLVAEQARTGLDPLVLAGSGVGGAGDAGELRVRETTEDGIRVLRIATGVLFHDRWDRASPRVDEAFRAVIATERPDVVHLHHWLRLGRGLVRACAAAGIPCVITAHDLFATCPRAFRVREDELCERPLGVDSCLDCVPREAWVPDAPVRVAIDRFVDDMRAELAAAAFVVAPSRSHAESLRQFAPGSLPEVVVVPHAPLQSWQAPARTERTDRRVRIAHWGNLDRAKGVHVFLEALHRLNRNEDVEIALWGAARNRDYAAEIERLGEGLPLSRRETFVPNDLVELGADLAVFPSLAPESHSFVLDEALSLGVPVIVSDRGAPPARVGGAGVVVVAGDAAALAERIGNLIDHPEELARMRAAMPSLPEFAEHGATVREIYERAVRGRPTVVDESKALANAERLALAFEDVGRELAGKLAQVEARAMHLDAAIEGFEQSCAQSTERLAELEGDLNQHKALAAGQQDDLAQHREALRRTSTDLDQHRSALCRASTDLEQHRAELARVNDDLEQHQAELMRVRGEFASLAALPGVAVIRHVAEIAKKIRS